MNIRHEEQASVNPDTETAAIPEAGDNCQPSANRTNPPSRQIPAETSLPGSRGARLLHMGRLAGGIAGGALAEGFKRLATGRPLSTRDLMLTPANASRLSDRLAEMRGAAMKVGQLISMEAGELLPTEFTTLLDRLRDNAHAMPLVQVASVLNKAWGKGWDDRFRRFMFTPLAAASIGQVHEAVTRDENHLAVKIQYPRVRESIDGDVDNVATLLRLLRLLPQGVDLSPLLEEAKRQLHQEADYLSEAAFIEEYRRRLDQDPAFMLPRVIDELTTPEVLSMSFVPGAPVNQLAEASASLKDAVASQLLALAFRECFDWGLVQTDPNFANYRYDTTSGRIGLLDFGATRRYTPERVMTLRRLLSAAIRRDRSELEQVALEAGYLDAEAPAPYRDTITGLLMDVTEPARRAEAYDFSTTDLATRMTEKVIELRLEQRYWHLPPVDILYLHRKLGGLYLISSRLRARVDVKALVEPYLL